MACMYTIFTLLTTRIQVHVEVDCAFLGNVSITVTDVMQRKIKVHFCKSNLSIIRLFIFACTVLK